MQKATFRPFLKGVSSCLVLGDLTEQEHLGQFRLIHTSYDYLYPSMDSLAFLPVSGQEQVIWTNRSYTLPYNGGHLKRNRKSCRLLQPIFLRGQPKHSFYRVKRDILGGFNFP
jgi:hypothetical protein